MAFDLDDQELKATKDLPCNKIRYNYKLEWKKEANKAIRIIKNLFMNQAEENMKKMFPKWFEIDYEDTQELMCAINILINAYEKDERIRDRMLDSFIGLDSDLKIVRHHARIDTKEKKLRVLKEYEMEVDNNERRN